MVSDGKSKRKNKRGGGRKKGASKLSLLPKYGKGEFAKNFTFLPRSEIVWLPMTQTIDLSTNVGAATTKQVYGDEVVYRLNSIYSPRFTSGNAYRVLGYTDISAQYRKYRVLGVQVKVTFKGVTDAYGCDCGVAIQASGNSQSLASNRVDTTDAKAGFYSLYLTADGSQKVTFKKYYDLSMLEGLSPLLFASDLANYAASITGSPTLTPYLRVAIANIHSTTEVQAQCEIELRYKTQLFDKMDDAQVQYTA